MEFSDDDLFAVANSIAELIGAPVTVEDQDTIVLAYSGGEQAVDEARIGTILSRQVPLQFRNVLAEAGVFDRLNASDDIIYVDLPQAHMTPRAVVAVRENDRLVGSIWAAVHGVPTAEQERVLTSAAPLVARLIGRERERADSSRRERRDLVTRLLAGGRDAAETARSLGLQPPMVVAAIGSEARIGSDVSNAVSLHLGAVVPQSVCAQIDATVYAVIGADEVQATRIIKDFLARSRKGASLMIGLGRQVDEAHRIDVSRADADLALDTMLKTARFGEVGTLRERFTDVLAVHASAFLEAHADLSPLTALVRHDREHDTHLVEAVRAFLDAGGDVAQAAEAIHVHPNTMRNRLRRADQSCGIDLADGDTRLALMLHLKVEDLARPTA